MSKPIYLIVAVDKNLGIGKQGSIPWYIPADLRRFSTYTKATQDSTKQNAVVMGRRTWDSLPVRFKPLPGRVNIVLSRTATEFHDAVHAPSFVQALDLAERNDEIESIYVVGGESVYAEALPYADKVFITEVMADFKCDVRFPIVPYDFNAVDYEPTQINDDGVRYRYVTYSKHKP